MAEAGTLHDAFIDELRDTYDAERQLTKALTKLAESAGDPQLREAFQTHLAETEGQIERLTLAQMVERAEGAIEGVITDRSVFRVDHPVDGPELYFTRNAVVGDAFDDLEVGMVVHVTRATTEGPLGPQASSVKLLGRAKSAT